MLIEEDLEARIAYSRRFALALLKRVLYEHPGLLEELKYPLEESSDDDADPMKIP